MGKKTIICSIILIYISLFAVFSIDDGSMTDASICKKTVESIKMQILAQNSYEITKELQQLEKILRKNPASIYEKEMLTILMLLCYCEDPEILGKESLLIRKKSIELIGLLGKQSMEDDVVSISKDVLIDVLSASDTAMISSLCIHSLGVIGQDRDGKAIKAINNAMEKQNSISHNDLFALAVTNAIEQIAITNNGIDDWRVFVSLIYIVQGNYNEMIREKALSVMEELKTY